MRKRGAELRDRPTAEHRGAAEPKPSANPVAMGVGDEDRHHDAGVEIDAQ
jgi:hypothetical protein